MFRQGRDEFVLFFNKRPRFVSTLKPRAVFSIIHSGLTWAGPPDLNPDTESNFYLWKVLIKKTMGVGIVLKCSTFSSKLNLF